MKFDIIMVCPPWKRYNIYRRSSGWMPDAVPPKIKRSLETFQFMEQCLGDHTSTDHLVFVWATNKNVMDARDYMTRLGYRLHQAMIWVRPKWKIGSGKKTVEFLLVCSKGKLPVFSDDYLKMIESEFTGRVNNKLLKPADAYKLLEREFPGSKMLQLYGCTKRPGWTVFHKNDKK